MKLQELFENENQLYYAAAYVREDNTCFHGKTVAPSESKAKAQFMNRIHTFYKENNYKMRGKMMDRIRTFQTPKEINEFISKFSNKIRLD